MIIHIFSENNWLYVSEMLRRPKSTFTRVRLSKLVWNSEFLCEASLEIIIDVFIGFEGSNYFCPNRWIAAHIVTLELNALHWLLLTVPDQSFRGGYMLCFLDDGQGMSPGTLPFFSRLFCYGSHAYIFLYHFSVYILHVLVIVFEKPVRISTQNVFTHYFYCISWTHKYVFDW